MSLTDSCVPSATDRVGAVCATVAVAPSSSVASQIPMPAPAPIAEAATIERKKTRNFRNIDPLVSVTTPSKRLALRSA
jgi:hypothetical protein